MNIFLINGTGLQLIHAEELKYLYGISDDNAILAIRKTKNDPYKFSIRSHEEVAQYGKWKEVHFIDQFKFKSFKEYIRNSFNYINKAEEILQSCGKIDRIFLGNYGNEPMRHIANKYAAKGTSITFLDEGIGTLHLYKSRELKNTGSLKRESVKNKIVKGLTRSVKEMIYGMKLSDVSQPVTFFTQYNLPSTALTKIETNHFTLLRKRIQSWKETDEVYFVGNAFVNAQSVSKEDYNRYIAFICDYFKGKKIQYFPHPRESAAHVAELKDQYGFDVVNTDVPFEMYLLQNKILPATIGGFTSTALSSVHKMFGENVNVVSFKMPYNTILNKRPILENLYNHFHQEFVSKTFSVVEIKY